MPYSVSADGGSVVIKAGDPHRIVTGTHEYWLEYVVHGGMSIVGKLDFPGASSGGGCSQGGFSGGGGGFARGEGGGGGGGSWQQAGARSADARRGRR